MHYQIEYSICIPSAVIKKEKKRSTSNRIEETVSIIERVRASAYFSMKVVVNFMAFLNTGIKSDVRNSVLLKTQFITILVQK